MLARRSLLSAFLLAFLPVSAGGAELSRNPATAPPGAYRLDPAGASLRVRIPVMGGLYTSALRFQTLAGGFTHDPADWRRTQVTITVDPRSATSAQASVARAVIDELEPARFPAIRFQSHSLKLDPGGRGVLAGDLTMHGVTRPIVLDVIFKGVEAGGGDARLAFSGAGRVRRSDFGLAVGRPFASDMADLVFDVQFVRK